MTRLPLSIALGDYDHTRDIISGAVRIEGAAPRVSVLSIEEITNRFMHFRDLDVCELSLGNYSTLLSRADGPAIAIPVFLSRVFRHGAIYVREDSALSSLADLAGKTIGLPQWSQTATVYVRGLLADTGIALSGIEWVQAGLHESGRLETAAFDLPGDIRLRSVHDRSLTEMLLSGDLDAVMSARAPRLVFDGRARIRPLLGDIRGAEQAYGESTGIFPIMHLLVIRRDVYEANRWIARNLMHAFSLAKQRSIARMSEGGVSYLPMAWGVRSFEEASKAVFGTGEPWPYGLAGNRPTIEAFLGYARAQGLLSRDLRPEDIFAPETLLDVKI